ncbi:MAG: c-type cytochrome [Bacteroidetes bacterium]|nr:c-type cytochrome [Bacteroidota bacterium]
MKSINKVVYLLAISALSGFSACTSGGNDPGVEYAPDMYVSKGYEPMSQLADQERSITFQDTVLPISADGKAMRDPVKNTIARGQLDYYFPYKPNDQDEKEQAGRDMKNPLPLTQENLEKGRHYYNINCLPCHGNKGLGDGKVAAKYPPNYIPSYKSDRVKNLEDGSKYYVITHGWNFMGAYGRVLKPEARWQVVHYVNYLEQN